VHPARTCGPQAVYQHSGLASCTLIAVAAVLCRAVRCCAMLCCCPYVVEPASPRGSARAELQPSLCPWLAVCRWAVFLPEQDGPVQRSVCGESGLPYCRIGLGASLAFEVHGNVSTELVADLSGQPHCILAAVDFDVDASCNVGWTTCKCKVVRRQGAAHVGSNQGKVHCD
jgi:hypothetical protein